MRALPLAALAACGGAGGGGAGGAALVNVPERAATAGDALLAQLPVGAEILVEIDLARLRGNPVVGEVAKEFLHAPPAFTGASDAPLEDATAIALAAYNVGTPAASTITVVAGGTRPPEAIDLGDERWALAAEGDTAVLLATDAGGPSVAGDATLLTARAWAMPAAADGASLRVAACLSDDARAGLAESFGLSGAPTTISVWGDVADDLAIIARFADASPGKRKPVWLGDLARLLTRAAASPSLEGLGLSAPITNADVRRERSGVTITILVAPGRLRRAVERYREAPKS